MRYSCPGRSETSDKNERSRRLVFMISLDIFEMQVAKGPELTAIMAFNTLFRFQGT